MKVALNYIPSEDDSSYGNIFNFEQDALSRYYPLDMATRLVPGTGVHLVDKQSGMGIDLQVIRWEYELDDNLLALLVITDRELPMEASPKQFRQYISKNWKKYEEIRKWALA